MFLDVQFVRSAINRKRKGYCTILIGIEKDLGLRADCGGQKTISNDLFFYLFMPIESYFILLKSSSTHL